MRHGSAIEQIRKGGATWVQSFVIKPALQQHLEAESRQDNRVHATTLGDVSATSGTETNINAHASQADLERKHQSGSCSSARYDLACTWNTLARADTH